MSQQVLTDLELKVDYMLHQYIQLKNENAMLREQLSRMNLERNLLVQKKQQAASKVKQIIEQIRKESV
jgi:uncharacterized protein (TIGR02449 family)